jgi:hypothetical protein
LLLALAYGISLFVRWRAQQKARSNYIKGFVAGFAIYCFSAGSSFLTSNRQLPNGLGPWIDLFVEALMVGLVDPQRAEPKSILRADKRP